MAPSYESYETQTTINVSQHERSSSGAPPEGVQVENTEVIEDSLKDNPGAYKDGAVQTPAPVQPDDYDELYSLTPQTKISSQKPKTTPEARLSLPSDGYGNESEAIETQQEAAPPLQRNAIQDLLANGATVHAPDKSNRKPSIAVATDEQDELQRDDDGVAAPVGSHPKSFRKSNAPAPASKTTQIHTRAPNRAEATPARGLHSATSSLAALNARRALRDDGSRAPLREDAGPTQSTPKPTTAMVPKGVLQSRSTNRATPAPQQTDGNHTESSTVTGKLVSRKNLQTPARSQISDLGTTSRATTGKLPARKDAMPAPTPMSKVVSARPEKRRETGSEAGMGEGSDIVVGNGHDEDPDKLLPKTTKAKKSAAQSKTAKATSSYDMPESSQEQEPARPVKKAAANRKTKAKPPTKPVLKAAQSRLEERDTRPSTRAQQRQAEEAQQAMANASNLPGSRRSRMKSKSDAGEVDGLPELAPDPKFPTKPHDTNGNNVEKVDEGVNQPSLHDDYVGEETFTKKTTIDRAEEDVERKPSAGTAEDSEVGITKKGTTRRSQNTFQPPGVSQDAIVLSDRPEPSSSATPEPLQKDADRPTPAPVSVQVSRFQPPKTPAALRSSPPTTATGPNSKSGRELMKNRSSLKANIISFDRKGPRNQGSLSPTKIAPDSARPTRSSLPPAAGLSEHRVGSHAKLEAKRRDGFSSAATSVKSFNALRHTQASKVADNVADALAGFFKKPRQEESQFGDARSEEQPVSHIPTPKAPFDDDGFTLADDFDGPTLVENEPLPDTQPLEKIDNLRTKSQVAMPPPPAKAVRTNSQERAPTVPAMGSSGSKSMTHSAMHPSLSKNDLKRKLNDQPVDEIEMKRQRRGNDVKGIETKVAKTAPATITEAVTLPISRAKTINVTHQLQQKQPDHISCKISRHASQGSQSVDIHGSPVPFGMEVRDKATVLDTFSQQAGGSSDALHEEPVNMQRATASRKADASQEVPMPRSRHPEGMSSNKKRKPSGPHEVSQGITRVVRVDPDRPLVEDQIDLLSNDPFTSSDENRKPLGQSSSSSTFVDQLRVAAIEAQKEQRYPSRGPGATDDPEKTLVEASRYVPIHTRKRSFTASSSTSPSTTTTSSSALDDLSFWRNGLQSHQLNLFDELVHVSHRLVRQLVDRETAAKDIVEDYQRRGLHIVEQMELSHARQHTRHIQILTERKKRLRKDMSECGRKLNEMTSTVKFARQERPKRSSDSNDMSATLQSIMANYC